MEDLETYGQELARGAVQAALVGDDISLQSIKRQAVILAETHRIRVSNSAWGTVETVTSRASPEPPALACIEPTTGVARPGNQFAVHRNLISTQDRPELLEHAWSGPQVAASRARWSFHGHCTEG